MQIILRSKKEIKYASEIEKILKAMYPKFAIKVKIFPIKRKEKRKFIVNTDNEKIKLFPPTLLLFSVILKINIL